MPEQKNLSKDAYNDIRKMIFLDKFSPGQRVSYRKIAEQLGMSLTPVVQALKVMEDKGIVRHEPNRGFFVEKITEEEVKEAYALRELIELSLVETIIENLDNQGEKDLKQALDEFLEADHHKSKKLRVAKDVNFHMTMANLSGQNIAIWILRYLYDLLYLRFDKGLVLYHPDDQSNEEHQAIFDAIISRDVSATQEALQQHILNISSNTLDAMKNMASEIEDVDF